MAKLIWRLSDNLIYFVFSMETPENLQTNFTIKSQKKVSLFILFLYNPDHSNHSGN